MSGKIDDGEGILGDLMEFCSSDEFQVMAEKFCIENCHHFTEEEEHRLEYTYLHADFSSLFESHIQKFIDERGVSDREFYKLLRRAQENNDKSAEFIEVFLASCEYDSFVHLMRFMKQKMLALGDPRLANDNSNDRQNAQIEEEEMAHRAPSGAGDEVEETVDDIVVVEGSGMALLNALSSSNNGGNVKK